MTDDDIWASDDDVDQVSYDQKIAQREWEKMNEVHGNVSMKKILTAVLQGDPTTAAWQGCLLKAHNTSCNLTTILMFIGRIQGWNCSWKRHHHTGGIQHRLQGRCRTRSPIW